MLQSQYKMFEAAKLEKVLLRHMPIAQGEQQDSEEGFVRLTAILHEDLRRPVVS